MAALSYMQRRASGTYEFRKRLPEALAGKPVPAHMRDAFPDLINPKTHCFKRELVRSLVTKELKEAKRRDHQEALKASELFDAAVNALAPSTVAVQPVKLDLKKLGDHVYAGLLKADGVSLLGVGILDGPAAQLGAICLCPSEPCHDTLTDHRAFKLRKHSTHLKHGFPSRCSGVYSLLV